jgi:hypothetical protein
MIASEMLHLLTIILPHVLGSLVRHWDVQKFPGNTFMFSWSAGMKMKNSSLLLEGEIMVYAFWVFFSAPSYTSCIQLALGPLVEWLK